MILLAQLNGEKDSLEILFDREGLQILRNIIDKEWKEPVQKGDELYDFDHEHLASKEWGGDELTPEFSSPKAHTVNTVKLLYVGNDGEKLLSD